MSHGNWRFLRWIAVADAIGILYCLVVILLTCMRMNDHNEKENKNAQFFLIAHGVFGIILFMCVNVCFFSDRAWLVWVHLTASGLYVILLVCEFYLMGIYLSLFVACVSLFADGCCMFLIVHLHKEAKQNQSLRVTIV